MGWGSNFDSAVTGLNTGRTAKHVKRQSQLLAQQNAMIAEAQTREHAFKLATDPTYKAWWEGQVAAQQVRAAAPRRQASRPAARAARTGSERPTDSAISDRVRTAAWVAALIFVPYVMVLVPSTRRRLGGGWRVWFLALYAVVVLVRLA